MQVDLEWHSCVHIEGDWRCFTTLSVLAWLDLYDIAIHYKVNTDKKSLTYSCLHTSIDKIWVYAIQCYYLQFFIYIRSPWTFHMLNIAWKMSFFFFQIRNFDNSSLNYPAYLWLVMLILTGYVTECSLFLFMLETMKQ